MSLGNQLIPDLPQPGSSNSSQSHVSLSHILASCWQQRVEMGRDVIATNTLEGA